MKHLWLVVLVSFNAFAGEIDFGPFLVEADASTGSCYVGDSKIEIQTPWEVEEVEAKDATCKNLGGSWKKVDIKELTEFFMRTEFPSKSKLKDEYFSILTQEAVREFVEEHNFDKKFIKILELKDCRITKTTKIRGIEESGSECLNLKATIRKNSTLRSCVESFYGYQLESLVKFSPEPVRTVSIDDFQEGISICLKFQESLSRVNVRILWPTFDGENGKTVDSVQDIERESSSTVEVE